jgi:phenylacetate-coenzyme A ligase PaaK-like adenylate-forming protein
MIWNQPKECMSEADKRRMQGERLRKMVERVYHTVPFYRQRMQEMDIAPRDIRSIDDIVHLPFTTGSEQQGVRACSSRMTDDLFPILEARLAAFRQDHLP